MTVELSGTLRRRAYLDPARSIISRLGGVDVVARETERDRTRVYRWMYPRSRGGTGGIIPSDQIPTLIALAKRLRKPLKHSDFFPSR